MRRIFWVGIIGAVLVAMMGAVVVLGLLVTPVRAQIGHVISQALQGTPLAGQALQNAPQQAMKDEKGILVAGVFQDSPADKAGLVRGDIIVNVDGQAVNTVQDLESVLTKHKAGDTLQLAVQHGDTQKTVPVTLADVPAAPTAAAPTAAPSGTPQSGSQSGQQSNNNGKPFTYRMFKQSGPYLGIVPIGAGQDKGHTESFEAAGPQQGEVIRQVASGSPAEKAGLKVGEVILSVDGQQLDQQNTLPALIAQHKAGDSVKLQIQGTDGTTREVTATLASNPQNQNSAYLGVSVGGRGFRFHNGFGPGMLTTPGAMIQTVVQGSPAEKAGLKTGDVIQAVDGLKVNSAEALSSTVSGHKPGDSVTLSVFDHQSGSSKDVKVTLGDNPQKAGSAWLGISYAYFDPQQQPAQPGQMPGLPNKNGRLNGTQF